MTAPIFMERMSRTAPLGVRFWDPVTATSAIDGLTVEVFPRANPLARCVAPPNRSGVYVAHALPGLRDFEFSNDDPDVLWATALHPFRVEVTDPSGRYLPVAFDADLPARGLFSAYAPWLSPPQPAVLPGDLGSPSRLLLEHVPLFSAPTRPVPDPLAVVRAQLHDALTDRDGAWALLGVSIGGEAVGLGLADTMGRVAVLFPYPEPPGMRLSSPPELQTDLSWEVALTAYATPISPVVDPPAIPDLADLFASLASPRTVIESNSSPGAPFLLTYRHELTVRTAGAVGPNASCLLFSA